MRRICSVAVIGTLLVASSAFAAKQSAFDVASTAIPGASNAELVVPVTIKYDADLTALDIPLKYSEGVTLTSVTLGAMLDGYDFKVANIKAEDNLVIIGAINMVYGDKADLPAGEGVVAELHFRVDDPSVQSVTIEATELKNPDHGLYFVYNQYDENNVPHVLLATPEFEPVTVALSGTPEASAKPTEFALEQNYPNPFNPETKIPYALPSAASVKLEVYNVLGQKVRTLVSGEQDAGFHSVTWDSRDDGGAQVSSGVYFYKLSANSGEFVRTKKLMLLK